MSGMGFVAVRSGTGWLGDVDVRVVAAVVVD